MILLTNAAAWAGTLSLDVMIVASGLPPQPLTSSLILRQSCSAAPAMVVPSTPSVRFLTKWTVSRGSSSYFVCATYEASLFSVFISDLLSTTGACVAPSTSEARGASPSREPCSLLKDICFHWSFHGLHKILTLSLFPSVYPS